MGALYLAGIAGCVGFGHGEDGYTELIRPDPTLLAAEGPDPTDLDDPTGSGDTAGSGTVPAWTTADCTGHQRILVDALPLVTGALSCPGEVHRYELTRDFGSVSVDGGGVGCRSLDLWFLRADGSAVFTSGACGAGATPEGQAGAAAEIRNDSADLVWYDLELR